MILVVRTHILSTFVFRPPLSLNTGFPHVSFVMFLVPCHPQLRPQPDDPRLSCLGLPLSLPYEVETLAEMDDRLDLICCRLVECVKAGEWGLGFRMWDSALAM
jgi:hypothetical protein